VHGQNPFVDAVSLVVTLPITAIVTGGCVTKRLVTTVPSSPTSPGALVKIDAAAIIPE
jgi:hypothetical protein